MCPSSKPSREKTSSTLPGTSEKTPSTCFSCTRLNATTFKIVEDDQWSENPIIYAKLYEQVLVLLDTGCGGASRDPTTSLTSLRQFIETYPVPDNDGLPLNQDGMKDYVVICSHCHFDHIGGIAEFADSPVWASSANKPFIISPTHLPTHSLCRFVGMPTPTYTVTYWASDGQSVHYGDESLNLQIFHTPGHTPDSLSLWDPIERFLYVGDTIYEWAHIIFPKEGSVVDYSRSIGKLKGRVKGWNREEGKGRVKIACGHNTYDADAGELIEEVDSLLYFVVQGWVERGSSEMVREEVTESFEREDGRLGFLGPTRLWEEFRNDDAAMEQIGSRQS